MCSNSVAFHFASVAVDDPVDYNLSLVILLNVTSDGGRYGRPAEIHQHGAGEMRTERVSLLWYVLQILSWVS